MAWVISQGKNNRDRDFFSALSGNPGLSEEEDYSRLQNLLNTPGDFNFISSPMLIQVSAYSVQFTTIRDTNGSKHWPLGYTKRARVS